jgi:hypothetical protein
MTATHRIQPIVCAFVLVTTLWAAAVPVPAAADTQSGAEFDRITADIRASIDRHDMRSLHAYQSQLKRLVARATGD